MDTTKKSPLVIFSMATALLVVGFVKKRVADPTTCRRIIESDELSKLLSTSLKQLFKDVQVLINKMTEDEKGTRNE